MATQLQSSAIKQGNIHVLHPNQSTESETPRQPDPTILELSRRLHSFLDIDELLEQFSVETSAAIKHDGMSYTHATHEIDIQLERRSKHSCDYQLSTDGEALGQLSFYRRKAFSEAELIVLENLLCALIYPLRNALLYHSALQSALIDPLTGVKNRAGMDSAIQREVNLSKRYGSPLSILLLDIDHFKSINDRYGHACGDSVIQAVAKSITETVRGSDMVFRFGGEEFLMLLSCTDCKGTCLLAERIRKNIENLIFSNEQELRITASLGVSSMQMNDNPETLFKRADKALYQAKQYGRNQVITG